MFLNKLLIINNKKVKLKKKMIKLYKKMMLNLKFNQKLKIIQALINIRPKMKFTKLIRFNSNNKFNKIKMKMKNTNNQKKRLRIIASIK